MCTAISFPGVPGVNCCPKEASHVCRRARLACLFPQTHTVYSIHRIEKLRRICSREQSAGHGNNFVGLQHYWTGALVTNSPRSAFHLHHLIKIPRWNRKLRYNTFFYSVNWWILVLFKLSVMAGLSNSVIANTYSVQCILCIFFWFNIVRPLNSPFLSVFIAFHFIIVVTVQRKFFVYLLQILLQWVKWRVEIIYGLQKKIHKTRSLCQRLLQSWS